MIDDKRLRELCALVLRAQGPAFEEAISELAREIESREASKEKSTTKAGDEKK